jgi:hypothetical protein
MIPEPAMLEALGYEDLEIDVLRDVRRVAETLDDKERWAFIREAQESLWPDELTRFQKTSVILTKEDGPKLLRLNFAQRRFWEDVIVRSRKERRPIRAIVLKARQLGFSTLIQALHYFWCDQHPNRFAMTISYDEPSSKELFQKAHYVDAMHWAAREKGRASANAIAFKPPHNSTFYVGTAGSANTGRGYMIQHLHCSELPMWPNPEEVITAVHQAVPSAPFTSIIWESTAKGAYGLFYDKWSAAVDSDSGFIPFFAPWHWDKQYTHEFASDDHRRLFLRQLSKEDRQYMDAHKLTPEQMKWRAWKIDEGFSGDARQFKQEFPASAGEAFLTSGSPVFNPERVMQLDANATIPLWRGEVVLKL